MTAPLSPKGLAALGYAKQGWCVFPLVNGTKDQFHAGGWTVAATDDPERVSAWWSQWPDANIGVNLVKSGLVAIDADTYKPECGYDAFIKGKPVPVTYTQRSARGGSHLVFTTEPGEKFPGQLCAGVEIKHKGYILLAPSTFGTGTYEVTDRVPPAPCPDWVPRKVAPAPADTHSEPGRPPADTRSLVEVPVDGPAPGRIEADPDPYPAEPITDDRLVSIICGSPLMHDHYEGRSGLATRDWSNAWHALLRAFCRFSGDEEQVYRVAMASPLVQDAPPKDGVTRAQKANRLWRTEYAKAALKGSQERREEAEMAAEGKQIADRITAMFAGRR